MVAAGPVGARAVRRHACRPVRRAAGDHRFRPRGRGRVDDQLVVRRATRTARSRSCSTLIDLEDQAVLVLTDAVYLDAQWAHGFDPKLTAPAPFHTAAGTVENVPDHAPRRGRDRERADARLRRRRGLEGGGAALQRRPARDGRRSFPTISTPSRRRSTAPGSSSVIGALRPANVVLSMPKFDVTAQIRPGRAARAARRCTTRSTRRGPTSRASTAGPTSS